jgi:hypothetical protein
MNTTAKFQAGDQLIHLKSGGLYRVIGLGKIEANLEDVYIYEAMRNQTLWVRLKAEMEDGRFVRKIG